ncbi:MAG: ribbon-helix-helix domain-containing protein [Rhodospirillales bacterium]
MTGQNFSIRTDADKLDELDHLAQARNRSRNFVVNEAIDRYLAEERAWADKVRAGLAAAEAGDFAADPEVEALFGRLEGQAGSPADSAKTKAAR